MDITYKEATTLPEFIDAIRLRVEVFIKEQGFQPGWEPDEDDKAGRSFIAQVDGRVIATARARQSKKGEFKIERLATAKAFRGHGVGSGLIQFILKELLKQKPKRIWMQSQVQAKGFHEKHGFKIVSKPYDHYGVEHVDMEYSKLA